MSAPCVCGHAEEEHCSEPAHPSVSSCSECDCIVYEADESGPGGQKE